MKRLIFILLLVSTFCSGQDSIKFGGLDVDSIIVYPNTVWVKAENTPFECTFSEVTIGTQIWMAENLSCTDGEVGIYAYEDNESNVSTYGRLYTWAAAMRLDTAISGWHLPTLTELNTLRTYLGGQAVAGGKMKIAGTTYWDTPNSGADNSSGFNGIGHGYMFDDITYDYLKEYAGYWMSTKYLTRPRIFYLYYNTDDLLDYYEVSDVGNGVRLIKD